MGIGRLPDGENDCKVFIVVECGIIIVVVVFVLHFLAYSRVRPGLQFSGLERTTDRCAAAGPAACLLCYIMVPSFS